MYKIIIFIWLFLKLFSQSIIGSGLTRSELFEFLNTNYKPSATLGYNQARDVMYSIIDLEDDNTLKGIYTNYTCYNRPKSRSRPQTNAQNMNCEHSWPQSMGAGSEPQKSDLHHLYILVEEMSIHLEGINLTQILMIMKLINGGG